MYTIVESFVKLYGGLFCNISGTIWKIVCVRRFDNRRFACRHLTSIIGIAVYFDGVLFVSTFGLRAN